MTKAQKQAIVDYAAYQFACSRANRKVASGGYAYRMASFYASCGKPASAHGGKPQGKVHVERF